MTRRLVAVPPIEVPISPIPELVAELAAGRMVILCDEEDRENEGDLILAADHVTPDAINFMATHGRGGFERYMLGSVAAEIARSAGARCSRSRPK